MYLTVMKPYMERWINQLDMVNELGYLLLSYHMIGFTDINPSIENKRTLGWSMVTMAILNLLIPNVFLVIRALIKDCIYKHNYKKAEKNRIKNQTKNMLEKSRLALI